MDDDRDILHGIMVLICVVGIVLAILALSGCTHCERCPARVEYRTVEVPVPVPCPVPPNLQRPALPQLEDDAPPESVAVVLVQALRDVIAWGEQQAALLDGYREGCAQAKP